ncbi:hypothetical protein [Methylorubrum extorquens]|nr:hypothetical protein [Methylorubrum extorquens]
MLDPSCIKPTSDAIAARAAHRRVVICGSMTFYGEMLRIQELLERSDVPTELPDAEGELVAGLDPAEYERFKRRVSLAHLRRVRHRMTFAVLVLNLDKHDRPDYIGPSTYAEIAMASAFSKPVYLLGNVPSAYAGELAAWKAVPLNGRMERLVEDYWASCVPRPQPQMRLFNMA